MPCKSHIKERKELFNKRGVYSGQEEVCFRGIKKRDWKGMLWERRLGSGTEGKSECD